MMRVLKYIIVFLICLMSTSFIVKKNVPKQQTKNTYTDNGVIYIDWKVSGSGYWINYPTYSIYNDFSFMVARTSLKYGDYYYYSIWLYSQSYYWDGYNANYTSTNIRYVNVYVDGYLVSQDNSSIGITFYDKTAPKSIRFKSTNRLPKVYITWKQMGAK